MNSIKFNRFANHAPTWIDLIDEVLNPIQKAGNKSSYKPAINIIENEGDYTIELAAPGLKKEDFEIKVEKDQLLISANKDETKEKEAKNYKRKEFGFKNFKRSFHLPETLDGEHIEANYEAGILSLNIPKKEEAIIKPKMIKIS